MGIDSRYVWCPMETAPRDGTPIQAKIPGHGSNNIIQWMCIDDYWTWGIVGEHDWPDSWDDGICWASNSSEQPSVLPVAWKPLERNNEMDR